MVSGYREGATVIQKEAGGVVSVRGIAPCWLILICLLLGVGLAYWLGRDPPDLNTVALGEQTIPVYGSFEGRKMFCGTVAESAECLRTAKANGAARRVLWIGNSQLHAINQYRPGQVTAPVLLAQRLAGEGIQVMGFSMPNASLSEMLLMYEWVASDYRPDVLLLPAFLDDTRELSIRSDLGPVARRPDIAALLDRSGIGADLRQRIMKEVSAEGEEEADGSMQARSESWITRQLEDCCLLQTRRAAARANIEIHAYLLRNWAFNVNAQTVRPIIPEIYRRNMAAADALLADARNRGTHVIFYLPPIRQDYAPPYDPAEYARFKREIAAMARRHGARPVDLDAIIPARYWGTKGSTTIGGAPELDFMHYQEPGHRMLADAVLPIVREELK